MMKCGKYGPWKGYIQGIAILVAQSNGLKGYSLSLSTN